MGGVLGFGNSVIWKGIPELLQVALLTYNVPEYVPAVAVAGKCTDIDPAGSVSSVTGKKVAGKTGSQTILYLVGDSVVAV